MRAVRFAGLLLSLVLSTAPSIFLRSGSPQGCCEMGSGACCLAAGGCSLRSCDATAVPQPSVAGFLLSRHVDLHPPALSDRWREPTSADARFFRSRPLDPPPRS